MTTGVAEVRSSGALASTSRGMRPGVAGGCGIGDGLACLGHSPAVDQRQNRSPIDARALYHPDVLVEVEATAVLP